jgi:O-antigen/teichoic acid export membrane protein
VLTPLVRRHVLAHPAPSAPLPDLSVRRAAPIAFGAGLTTMYGRVDTWLVALVGMPNAAALYGASYRVMEAIMIPADAIGAVALTEGVRATEGERGKVARRFSAAAVGLTLVPGLVLCAFAPLVLRVVFGPTFEQAAGTLRLLLVSAIIGAVAAAIGPLAALVGGRRYPVVVGAVLVLNVGANLVLVPAIGMQGAAWANVVSESALAALFGALLAGRRQGRSNT